MLDPPPATSVGKETLNAEIVGRERELELIGAALDSGRDVLLEGPPGTSKTTILRALTRARQVPFVFAEGNAELTPARLLGYHDPASVLNEGYTDGAFVPGPLLEAMSEGGFLYLEEFNRAPEDTLNCLLTAIADRQIVVPRVGTVVAGAGFRLVGSMNPFDNVGTTRLSMSIKDRFCRFEIGYQDEDSEREIVRRRAHASADPLDSELALDAVRVTRLTRTHPAVRQGSSVRGAIDTCALGRELMRGRDVRSATDVGYWGALADAVMIALSGRITVDETADTTARRVLEQILDQLESSDGAAFRPG